MDFKCGFKAKWSPKLQNVVLSNMLVNPTGKKARFEAVGNKEELTRAVKKTYASAGLSAVYL